VTHLSSFFSKMRHKEPGLGPMGGNQPGLEASYCRADGVGHGHRGVSTEVRTEEKACAQASTLMV